MSITLKHLQENVFPSLQAIHGNNQAALKKAIRAVLKQGDEEIPVVNEEGEPVQIEEIILIGAPPEEVIEEEEEVVDVIQDSISDAVDKAVGQAMSQLAKSGAKKAGTKATRITGGDFRNDDERAVGWKTAGQVLRAVKMATTGQGPVDNRLHTKATGMSEHISSDGGFLLAPEMSDRIMEIVNKESDLLSRTDNFSIQSSSTKINAIDESSRATGSRRGGVRGYWVGEGATLTASAPKMRQMTIEPKKLAVLVYATDEQLQDTGPLLEQLITRSASEEITFSTGNAIINGAGAQQPLGILNAGCTVSQAKQGSQAAATIVKANVDKMWSRLHASSRANAVWLVNQDCEPQLQQLGSDFGNGWPLFLPPGGLNDSPNSRLYGREVIASEFCSTLGTVGDIILVDLSQYVAVTKGDVAVATSIHVQFTTDETAFRFIYRVDGQPWWSTALTPFKGSNTQSPFITLATRS